MLIVWGLHRKQNPFSTRVIDCLACRRPTPHDYIAVKKAGHVFWIPFLPLGADLYRRCQHCGNTWEISDAPLDTSFFAYFGLVALLLGSNVIGLTFGWCNVTIILIIPAILISVIYLFTVPSSYSRSRPDFGDILLQPSPGAVPYTYARPPPAQPTAQDLYARDYAARASGARPLMDQQASSIDINCTRCLRKYQVPYGVPVAICPYCGTPSTPGQQ